MDYHVNNPSKKPQENNESSSSGSEGWSGKSGKGKSERVDHKKGGSNNSSLTLSHNAINTRDKRAFCLLLVQ